MMSLDSGVDMFENEVKQFGEETPGKRQESAHALNIDVDVPRRVMSLQQSSLERVLSPSKLRKDYLVGDTPKIDEIMED